ncbi:MAG TPA: GntR family transcriptional regulator [Nitrolancea sp.]|nr:GntR family transcriptional regulator [Nitrolancea sp.]
MKEIEETKLRRPSRLRIVDDVYQSLEEAILTGQVLPGARLVETSIAGQLDVSRTTVREAFLMLERQGLVASEPRRGTFVTRLSRADALDLGYSRSLLEAFAVTVGHHRIDAKLMTELELLLVEMGGCELPEEFPRLVTIDLDFHAKLVELADMPRLFELWSSLSGQIGALYIRGVEEMNLRATDLEALHRKLLHAIRCGPAAGQLAIIQHYVREDGSISTPGRAAQDILSVVSARFAADPAKGRSESDE